MNKHDLVVATWPESFKRGLAQFREDADAELATARALKSYHPKHPKLRRIQDPDVKKADRGDDHLYVQKITGATVHE